MAKPDPYTVADVEAWESPVTCVIGTIKHDPYAEPGDDDAVMAGMRLIANHDADGVFHFDVPGFKHYEVTVKTHLL